TAGLTLEAFGLAYVLAISVATLWLYPRVLVNEMRGMWTAGEVIRLGGVGLLTLAGTAGIVYVMHEALPGQTWAQWAIVVIGGASSLVLLALAAWALRLPEAAQLSHLLRGVRR